MNRGKFILPLFDYQKLDDFNNKKIVRILNIKMNVLDFIREKLYFNLQKTYASSDNNPKRKPAVLNVDSVTVFWIIAAFLFIPLVLTGLFSH